MNVILIIILILAETAAVFFAGYTTSEKRYSAADAARLTQATAIATHTKMIVEEHVKWRTANAQANVTNEAAVRADIAAHPTPLTCPAISTGLLNSYIDRANSAGRVLASSEGPQASARPSNR